VLKDLSASGGFFQDISVFDEERLVNMEELGDDKFAFFALPLEIKGRDGSPVKPIAIMDVEVIYFSIA
jgi:hypothetical protein